MSIVEVIRDQISFNDACAARPPVGTLGEISDLGAPSGKTAVRFFAPDLGYEWRGDDHLDDDNYLTLYLESNTLREIKLNPLDEFVKTAMLSYPSIFPTRTSVLCHAYLVLGNGLRWKNGVLSGGSGDCTEMKYDDPDKHPFGDGAGESLVASWRERIVAENVKREKTARHIDYYATLKSKAPLPQSHYERAEAVAAYESVPVWGALKGRRAFVEGAVEILNLVIGSTPPDDKKGVAACETLRELGAKLIAQIEKAPK